ncbi:LysR family transcriptional regulator [Demequina litorisediminis]|uniref:LysR family transcriptional regulator n=1 Tax=Demequina litorisediminis TaxID=1849022 RepID=A0ABQ6I9U4_9MICO|nr:LysR family transcriptional regulator [Demequina litorisediminis]GMA33838.1 LysR family transcriptional regulator [Demequina litorisediminis]
MEVRHLELLRDLRDRGTLAAVAEASFRTPSALSQQLKTAERELGVALVEPYSRGLRLTWAGQILADGADDVLTAVARVQGRLDAGRGAPAGTVKIGTLPSAGAALMPGLFTRLADTLIDVVLDDFDLAEADYAARTADADLVIAHSLSADVPAGAHGLVSRVVLREPIDVAVPSHHRLASRDAVGPADVCHEPWVAVPPGYPFGTIHESIEAASGVPLNRIARVRDNRLVESLVEAGHGVGLLPRFSTPASAGLVLLPLTGVRATRSIVALARRDRAQRRAVSAVVDLLAEVGATLEERVRPARTSTAPTRTS